MTENKRLVRLGRNLASCTLAATYAVGVYLPIAVGYGHALTQGRALLGLVLAVAVPVGLLTRVRIVRRLARLYAMGIKGAALAPLSDGSAPDPGTVVLAMLVSGAVFIAFGFRERKGDAERDAD